MSTGIIIRDFYPHNRPSGVISCLNEFLPHLPSDRVGKIYIITAKKHGERQIYYYKGITVIKISQYNILKFILILKKLPIDKIIIFSSISKGNILFIWWYLVTLICKDKTLFYQTTNLNNDRKIFQRKIKYYLIRSYNKIIVTNGNIYNQIRNFGKNINPYIINPGTNITSKKARKNCQYNTVTFAGHWSYVKGTDIVLRISKELPEINFRIVAGIGKNRRDKELYEYYENNKYKFKNVENIGYVKNPIQYIDASDILILPYRTGVGVLGVAQSAIEAMALGIPVLSTKNSSISEILEHNKNGYYCRNIDDYKSTIRRLINDKKLYSKLSQGCLNTCFDKLSAKKNADKLIRVITDESIPKN